MAYGFVVDDSPAPELAIIVNPTKFTDLDAVRREVAAVCGSAGVPEPRWYETTAEDPGTGQARQAVADGATIVCPLGGDGTVRAVATALVGTETPLGLLPGGTGNLLARNLGLPVDDLGSALRTVISGSDTHIDVGLVRLTDQVEGDHGVPPAEGESVEVDLDDAPTTAEVAERAEQMQGEDARPAPSEEVFLIMAGMGLDAEVMGNTNEAIKARVGWAAYVLAGARRLWGRRFGVVVTTEDAEVRQHARSVIVGNCGALQGGLELMPDARLDDGVLDTVVLAPHGAGGWAAVVVDLATRHRKGHASAHRLSSTGLTVHAGRPVATQIDGDYTDEHRVMEIRVWPAALVVRVA